MNQPYKNKRKLINTLWEHLFNTHLIFRLPLFCIFYKVILGLVKNWLGSDSLQNYPNYYHDKIYKHVIYISHTILTKSTSRQSRSTRRRLTYPKLSSNVIDCIFSIDTMPLFIFYQMHIHK